MPTLCCTFQIFSLSSFLLFSYDEPRDFVADISLTTTTHRVIFFAEDFFSPLLFVVPHCLHGCVWLIVCFLFLL
jgi:hypothetical protein